MPARAELGIQPRPTEVRKVVQINEYQHHEQCRIPTNRTAIHEAKHAVVAEKRGTTVELATIRPGSGYNGMTRLSQPDIVAAAAPHSHGMSGTSWDVHIIHMSGGDVNSAALSARSILRESEEEVDEVANLLESSGTATGSEIRGALRDGEERRKRRLARKKKVGVVTENEKGEREEIITELPENVITFPGRGVFFNMKMERFEEPQEERAA